MRSIRTVILLCLIGLVGPLLATAPATAATPTRSVTSAAPERGVVELAEVERRAPERKTRKRVRLVIRIASCRGCVLTVHGGYRGSVHHWTKRKRVKYVGGPALMSKGRVWLKRVQTRGLMIEVYDPRAVRPGAAQFVVMRFGSLRRGKVVPDPHYDSSAYGCWAGTKRKQVTLTVGMAHVDGEDIATGESGYVIAPFLVRGVRTIGPARETLGMQALLTQELAGFCG